MISFPDGIGAENSIAARGGVRLLFIDIAFQTKAKASNTLIPLSRHLSLFQDNSRVASSSEERRKDEDTM